MLLQIELNSLSIPLIYMVLWFVLPLFAAFILFRFSPSRAVVSGPFKGLSLQFTGAFAGYFILFFMCYLMFGSYFKKAPESCEVWTINGNIESSDNEFELQRDQPSIVPLEQHFQRNRFVVKVIARQDPNGLLEFPMLTLTSLNYKSEDLPDLTFNKFRKNLGASYEIMDPISRIIRLKKPIQLKSRLPEALVQASFPLSVDTSLNQQP